MGKGVGNKVGKLPGLRNIKNAKRQFSAALSHIFISSNARK